MLTGELLQKYYELMEEQGDNLKTNSETNDSQLDDDYTVIDPLYLVPTEVLVNLKNPANHALKSYNEKQLELQARIIKASIAEAIKKEESKQTTPTHSGKRLKKSIFK